MRTERDPLLRIVLADAIYRSDPDQGGGPLLEAMPPSPELFLRLRSVGRELALPVPAVSSLLDLAVDGSGEAMARLFALAPLARGNGHDEQLAALLSDGLVEVGDASPEEMFTALKAAPSAHAQAAIELVAAGLEQSGTEVAKYPLAQTLHREISQASAPDMQLEAWLAVVERRPARTPEAIVHAQPPAPAGAPAAAGSGGADGSTAPPVPAPPVAPAGAAAPSGSAPAVPSASRTSPAVLITPATDAKPASAVCTGQSPACPGGG